MKKPVYGSLGRCGECHKRKKLHCRIDGVVHCMACYGKHRLKDPKKRKRQNAACKEWYRKNKGKMREYYKNYHAKQRA